MKELNLQGALNVMAHVIIRVDLRGSQWGFLVCWEQMLTKMVYTHTHIQLYS